MKAWQRGDQIALGNPTPGILGKFKGNLIPLDNLGLMKDRM